MKTNRLASLFFLMLLACGCNKQVATSATENGVDKNATIQKLKTKAESGDADAQLKFGGALFNGDGVAKDYAGAVKWFRKAAEQNLPAAQFNLGVCYANGQGVVKDEVEAVRWLRKAAEQNYAAAQNNLGNGYYLGEGVSKDFVEAAKWYHKAAEQNYADAQFSLGGCYLKGEGVEKDLAEAAKWYRKAAELGNTSAQLLLGAMYNDGMGTTQNFIEAAKWFRKAAEQGDSQAAFYLATYYSTGRGGETNKAESARWFRLAAEKGDANAQLNLAGIYFRGDGVPKDYAESFKWMYKAADQGIADAQFRVGIAYLIGIGVPENNLEAYKWFNLSAARGDTDAKTNLEALEHQMTLDQIAEAQKLTREYKPGALAKTGDSNSKETQQEQQLTGNGTGFFITDDGYLISNYHVVKEATKVRLVTKAGMIDAKVVQVDAANDLALLKVANGEAFKSLPILSSRSAHLGGTVATIGFPDPSLQGFSPKLAKGEIASLSGAGDDPRYFQISVPVQPGNSGGALVDEQGNVIGIVSAKLDASVALAASGALPENVNYAVKSSLLLSFLESVPEVSAKLKAPNTTDEKFEDVVKSAQDAAVLVLVY